MSRAIVDVLDISSLKESRGFVSSSSDEGDGDDLKDGSKQTGDRLGSLFDTENEEHSKRKASLISDSSTTDKNSPLFSSFAHLFRNEGNAFSPCGVVGISIFRIKNQNFLITYNSTKQRLNTFLLAEKAISLSVNGDYIYLSSAKVAIALTFSADRHNDSLLFCALIVLLSDLSPCTIFPSKSTSSLNKGLAICQRTLIRLDEEGIHLSHSTLSFEYCDKTCEDPCPPIIGTSKISKLDNMTVQILTVEKTEVVDNSQPTSSSPSSNIKHQDLTDIPSSELVPEPHPTSSKSKSAVEDEFPKPKPLTTPIPASRRAVLKDWRANDDDYLFLHRLIGTEMDRLEQRLEVKIERTLERLLAPLAQKMSKIEEEQERLNGVIEKLQEFK